MLFGTGGHLDILFREYTHDTSCDLVVYNGLVILTDDVNPEFLNIV